MIVGDSWQDNYTEADNDTRLDVSTTNTVLSFSEITLPAGTYDAFLVQSLVVADSADGTATTTVYTWFTPDIGRVAEIVSMTDETEEVFDTAAAFYRLNDFSDAG
jgi:hypothetical protein